MKKTEANKETGCFVVNLVPKSLKEAFDYLGSHSGRDEDKLADCPVNIECGCK